MFVVAAGLLLLLVMFVVEIVQDPLESYAYQLVARFLNAEGAFVMVSASEQVTTVEMSREAKSMIVFGLGVLALLVCSSFLRTLISAGIQLLNFSITGSQFGRIGVV